MLNWLFIYQLLPTGCADMCVKPKTYYYWFYSSIISPCQTNTLL